MILPGAGGAIWYVTAGGKLLGGDTHASGTYSSPRKALQAWHKLPKSERKPGALRVPDLGKVDSQWSSATPPIGGAIVKLHYRAFMRDAAGKLRHVTGKDLWHADGKNEAVFEARFPGSITTSQAQVDHLWLTKAEVESLMPAAPRQGDRKPVPTAIRDRILRWHLNPHLIAGEANALERKAIRASELTLTVDRISRRTVRLRLDGFAKLGAEPPATVKAGAICFDRWGYEPRLFGFLEYDPKTKVLTRFEVVAMGNQFGKLGYSDGPSRPGLQPLGVTFDLVKGDLPADRVPPGRTLSATRYFDADQ